MNFVRMLKSLVGKAPQSETIELRSIVISNGKRNASVRRSYKLRENAGGARNSMVKKTQCISSQSITHYAVVKAGPHIIRVTSVPIRYADDDEYALSQLPQQEQKKAWTEHHACAFLDFLMIFRASPGLSQMQRLMLHWRNWLCNSAIRTAPPSLCRSKIS
jgi:hypothetical protein